ncbi:MAG: hypothetical protein NTY38_07715, partial [Acidobacteria bacterium]|nr:hypothetical protein [Acidobacteriota bacterium]
SVDLSRQMHSLAAKLPQGKPIRRFQPQFSLLHAAILMLLDYFVNVLVIADITGCNGNVMFELGVAAAWLDKDRVVIIREDRQDEPRLFDINPARQVDYTKSPLGFQGLQGKLLSLIQDAIAQAPFEASAKAQLKLPAELDLTSERDGCFLWGPSGAHRRLLPGVGLEFGSRYSFRFGWLSVADLIARNVRVSGAFRFSAPRSRDIPYQPWIGVMLRSQGYLASSGHLALLRANGEIAFTREVDGDHQDVDIGKIKNFDPEGSGFVPFDIAIDEEAWAIGIGDISQRVPIVDLPLVFSAGRIVIEGEFCWASLRNLRVELLGIDPTCENRS